MPSELHFCTAQVPAKLSAAPMTQRSPMALEDYPFRVERMWRRGTKVKA
jgi:hypothetical protein